ncbi:tumor necrosis factor receptor superfamily member 9b [Chanos chanos]|uniref:Tumor necrosis factor receptor superfamily member 9b n=1 Tax=Chanos chanos TaxID=29144 RepID=A0A6J2VSG7_CHACN|nr:tumor necrosis factor receptor superfamily member 9 [Chanos chanos]
MLFFCGVVLFLSILVAPVHGVDPHCEDWIPLGTNVCCKKCQPGHRLWKTCGNATETLCQPCQKDEYLPAGDQRSCLRCTQCIGPQIEKMACNASRDTVCDCKTGLRCGDSQCSYCVQECGKGEQPTDSRTCEPCPNGTFNDQIHKTCRPWTDGCPEGKRIVTPGTAISDAICGSDISSELAVLITIFCMSVLICSVVPLCVMIRYKRKKLIKNTPGSEAQPEPRQEVLQEECSFCFPQQEHGGSSLSSIASLDSEEKLLSV